MYKFGFIGLGNMGSAILRGILSSGKYKASEITAFDRDTSKSAQFDIAISTGSRAVAESSHTVFICVKPQGLSELLGELKGIDTADRVFVSIVAGVPTSYISSSLCGAPVVRVMPNTPMLIGCGVSSLCRTDNVSDARFDEIEAVFACGGITARLPEDKMNEVIALTGSSPAYTFLYIKSLQDGARGLGLSDAELKKLACESVIGAAKLYLSSDKTAEQLIKDVTSPGGTTACAMSVFNDAGFEETVIKAMDACTKRAYELAEMVK